MPRIHVSLPDEHLAFLDAQADGRPRSLVLQRLIDEAMAEKPAAKVSARSVRSGHAATCRCGVCKGGKS